MIKASMNDKRSAPVWAAIGAPLIGIPVLVGLLSLTAPRQEVTEPDQATVVTVGRVDAGFGAHVAPVCEQGDGAGAMEG